MPDPRLTKLDQRRLIEERDYYRNSFYKAQEDLRIMQLELDSLKQDHIVCMPAEFWNLDNQ